MTDDPAVPPLVREARAVAADRGFEQSCSDATGRLLHVLVSSVRRGCIAELGTGTGVGAAWMASALEPGVELVTVDVDAGRGTEAAALFADLGNVDVVVGDWDSVASRAPFALVFCDAGPPKLDAVDEVVGLLEPGGIVVLDDYTGLDRRGDAPRDAWLAHPHLVATELLVSATEAVVLGVRR